MLISYKYKFIFIKTSKTAGTSIEVDLAKLIAKDDVVTPIYPHVDGHQARNYQRGFLRKDFYNHMPALKVKRILGQKSYDSFFKFCVEREPVDKTISHYFMWKSRNPKADGSKYSWEEYIERGYFPVDSISYTDAKNNLLVDNIIKYEALSEELPKICQRLGFEFPQVLTQAKKGGRKQVDVTPAQRGIIYDAFAPTLKHTPFYTP